MKKVHIQINLYIQLYRVNKFNLSSMRHKANTAKNEYYENFSENMKGMKHFLVNNPLYDVGVLNRVILNIPINWLLDWISLRNSEVLQISRLLFWTFINLKWLNQSGPNHLLLNICKKSSEVGWISLKEHTFNFLALPAKFSTPYVITKVLTTTYSAIKNSGKGKLWTVSSTHCWP